MATFKLRPVQERALSHTKAYFQDGGTKGILSIPCAGGKCYIVVYFIRDNMAAGSLTIVVTSRRNLVEDLAKACQDRDGDGVLFALFTAASDIKTPPGVNRLVLSGDNDAETKLAALWPKLEQHMHVVVITTYQSSKRLRCMLDEVIASRAARGSSTFVESAVVFDEAHQLAGRDKQTYQAMLNGGEEDGFNPDKILFLTATPTRMIQLDVRATVPIVGDESVWSMDNERIFGPILYEEEVWRLVEEGALIKPELFAFSRAGAGIHELYERYHKATSQDRAFMQTEFFIEALKSMLERGVRHVIVFAKDTNAAKHFAAAFPHCDNVRISLAHSKQSTKQNDLALRNFTNESAKAEVLVGVNMFNEGFNAPSCDAVFFMHDNGTYSWITQGMGRGMRVHPQKQRCLIFIPAVAPVSEDDTARVTGPFHKHFEVLRHLQQSRESDPVHSLRHGNHVMFPRCLGSHGKRTSEVVATDGAPMLYPASETDAATNASTDDSSITNDTAEDDASVSTAALESQDEPQEMIDLDNVLTMQEYTNIELRECEFASYVNFRDVYREWCAHTSQAANPSTYRHFVGPAVTNFLQKTGKHVHQHFGPRCHARQMPCFADLFERKWCEDPRDARRVLEVVSRSRPALCAIDTRTAWQAFYDEVVEEYLSGSDEASGAQLMSVPRNPDDMYPKAVMETAGAIRTPPLEFILGRTIVYPVLTQRNDITRAPRDNSVLGEALRDGIVLQSTSANSQWFTFDYDRSDEETMSAFSIVKQWAAAVVGVDDMVAVIRCMRNSAGSIVNAMVNVAPPGVRRNSTWPGTINLVTLQFRYDICFRDVHQLQNKIDSGKVDRTQVQYMSDTNVTSACTKLYARLTNR